MRNADGYGSYSPFGPYGGIKIKPPKVEYRQNVFGCVDKHGEWREFGTEAERAACVAEKLAYMAEARAPYVYTPSFEAFKDAGTNKVFTNRNDWNSYLKAHGKVEAGSSDIAPTGKPRQLTPMPDARKDLAEALRRVKENAGKPRGKRR